MCVVCMLEKKKRDAVCTPHCCRLKALDQQVKLAISHALAQSSKLSVYETRVADLVEQVCM